MKNLIILLILISNFAYADRSIVRCSSIDHHRRTCHADTSGGVELIEQLSHSSCHDNWGYTHNEIWVDNGCRAKFRLYVNNNHNSQYNNTHNNSNQYNNNHNSVQYNNNNHNNNSNQYNNQHNNQYNNQAGNGHHNYNGHLNIYNQTNTAITVECGHHGNQGHSQMIDPGHNARVDITGDAQGVVQCNAVDHHGTILSSNTFDVHHSGQSYNWNVNQHH